MRIAGIVSHSLVNGDGIRFVVFLQGCPHHCRGCQNPDTWDFNGGEEVSPEDIANQYKSTRFLDGITLSGGEPFAQQEACVELLKLLPEVNVWVYTGYEYEAIQHTEIAQRADVLVVGRFVEELKCEGNLYGSSNQRIIRRNRSEDKSEL
jgi:anaerobic ribonucleoside-triphosphate reductase activating protein